MDEARLGEGGSGMPPSSGKGAPRRDSGRLMKDAGPVTHELHSRLMEDLSLWSTVGDLPTQRSELDGQDPGSRAKERLKEDPQLPGVLVLEQGRLSGLLSRRRIHEMLSRPFGLELYMNRPIRQMLSGIVTVAGRSPDLLIVSEAERIDVAASRALARAANEMYEPVVVELLEGGWRLLDIQVLLLALSHILRLQNDELRRTQQSLVEAKGQVEDANRQIMESLDYARRIQTAFLPRPEEMTRVLPEHFLVWEPRDAVGGDCYWVEPNPEGFFLAVMDCTGHGVPGAFMTLIVSSLLAQVLKEGGGDDPARVLGELNVRIKKSLHKDGCGGDADDGMDAALLAVYPAARRIRYAGAGMPLLCLGPGDDRVRVLRGDRHGVGYARTPRHYRYLSVEIAAPRGTSFYIATDGVTDLVGAETGRTWGRRRLCQVLRQHGTEAMPAQREGLLAALQTWRGDEAPRDDLTVVGFRL